MHGIPDEIFGSMVASFLVWYYIALAAMNGIAAFYLWQKTELVTYFRVRLGGLVVPFTNALLWLLVAVGFVVLAALSTSNLRTVPQIPDWFRSAVNQYTGPVVYTLGTTALLAVLYVFRTWFVKPAVAWSIWNLMLLFLGLSMPNRDFYAIVAKPDNVPIVSLVFLLALFNWLAASRAVENDRRKEEGLAPLEKLDDEKVLVWPDLVYTEMICMIALTVVLILWAVWLQAPLEETANVAKTPNPSKAPWYFLGLQEMLVYYDPWMAGVVLPSLIIVGLMAIPYLDFNKSGNGYYTIKERRFAYIIFQVGFLELWVTLIVLGTMLRGPNWNFFGPYEPWDSHKVEALMNVYLSDVFWQDILYTVPPKAPPGSSAWTELGYILLREAPGIILVLGYFIVVPPLLAITCMRRFYRHMGFIRFMVLTNLLLFMAALPIKMVLRWAFNLKYLITIPEYFLNF